MNFTTPMCVQTGRGPLSPLDASATASVVQYGQQPGQLTLEARGSAEVLRCRLALAVLSVPDGVRQQRLLVSSRWEVAKAQLPHHSLPQPSTICVTCCHDS